MPADGNAQTRAVFALVSEYGRYGDPPRRRARAQPGAPWENGACESFDGTRRDEGLRQEIFSSLEETQAVIALGQTTGNRIRPDSPLGYRPPAPVGLPDLAVRLPMAAGRSSQRVPSTAGGALQGEEAVVPTAPDPVFPRIQTV